MMRNIKKAAVASLFLMGVQVALASFSFTGVAGEGQKSNKYSLKDLSTYSHRKIDYSLLRPNLQFRSSQVISQKNESNGSIVSSMLQFDKGNSTYIYSYKYKVKVPKFKTPSPVIH